MDFWNIPADCRPEPAPDFEVYPDNWDTVNVFVRMQTQWKISPMGQRVGLEYPSVPVVSRYMGIKITRELFADLQLMEMCTINEMARDGRRRSKL